MSEGEPGEQISPDGKWRWDGHNWVPHEHASASPASGSAYGQPQQPYGQYPSAPYGAFNPPQKSNTTRNVLLILGLVGLLMLGGCAALVGLAVNEVDNTVDEITANDDAPGGVDNPLTIEEGKAFDVYGFEYREGWSVEPDESGRATAVGLKFENQRESIDKASVVVKLLRNNELLATVKCHSESAEVGQVVPLKCYGDDAMPTAYDEITIADSY
ncbi:hypothetical protein LRP67_00070 [Nocardioides sp. cx-169]|uniref:hypothetical protein n=1 Tax=Nocardioides sp. cx-169 TaxID=2899080 RepID=UPI001E4074E7|nr:hypothetical protein [Nocardioides sp. cx-169]MCD4532486.1 hypothetical protein [Nocardioides sp. cx-169]